MPRANLQKINKKNIDYCLNRIGPPQILIVRLETATHV